MQSISRIFQFEDLKWYNKLFIVPVEKGPHTKTSWKLWNPVAVITLNISSLLVLRSRPSWARLLIDSWISHQVQVKCCSRAYSCSHQTYLQGIYIFACPVSTVSVILVYWHSVWNMLTVTYMYIDRYNYLKQWCCIHKIAFSCRPAWTWYNVTMAYTVTQTNTE